MTMIAYVGAVRDRAINRDFGLIYVSRDNPRR